MTKVYSTKIIMCTGAAALLLSACGGSDIAPINDSPLRAFQTLGDADQSMAARLSALPGSAFTAVPTGGSATFTGTGGVTMVLSSAADSHFRAIGDSSVAVDFGTEAITGGLTNLVGLVGTQAEVNNATNPDTLATVTGSISLSGGDLYALRPNRFGVSYGGTLNVDGTDYVVDGRAEGARFNGTRANPANGFPIKAVVITDQSDTFATSTAANAPVTTYSGAIGIYGESK